MSLTKAVVALRRYQPTLASSLNDFESVKASV